MSVSYLLENSLRAHDAAVMTWLSALTVDYGELLNVQRNNVPIIAVLATPDRAFAEAGQEFVKRGWITGANEDEITKRLQEITNPILPIISVYRSGFSEDKELAGGAKVFYKEYFNFSTGKWEAHQWPTMYRADYNISILSRYQFTHQHILSWFETQLNNPGQAQGEALIDVKHEVPIGTLKHSFRRLSISDASEQDTSGKRLVRTNMTWSLRMQVYKQPIEQNEPVLQLDPQTTNLDANGDPIGVVDPYVPAVPAQTTLNHFRCPLSATEVKIKWPKIGQSTVSVVAAFGATLPFPELPGHALSVTTVDQNDAALLWKSIVRINPIAVARYRFQARSSWQANFVMEQIVSTTSTAALLSRNIDSSSGKEWKTYEGLTLLTQGVFGAHLEGTTPPVSGISYASTQLSAIRCTTYTPDSLIAPSATKTVESTFYADFTGLPAVPHFFFVGGLSGEDDLYAYVVSDRNYSGSTAPNQVYISPDYQAGGAVISFTPPVGGLVSLRLRSNGDTPVTPSIVGAFPYR